MSGIRAKRKKPRYWLNLLAYIVSKAVYIIYANSSWGIWIRRVVKGFFRVSMVCRRLRLING